MNKRRIREPFHTLIWKASIGYNDSWSQVDPEVLEKFAELIVRECINIACEHDKPKLSGPGLAIASNIESHFNIYIEEDGRLVK